MYKTLAVAVIGTFLILSSCNNRKERLQSENIATEYMRSISIQMENEDEEYKNLGDILNTVSYVQLVDTPLLTQIKDIHIYDDKIYVWDKMSGIICYSMNGDVVYNIDAKGGGPGEYSEIEAFTINPDKNELVIYDNFRISLLYYSLENGHYLRTEKFSKPNPSEIVYFDSVYFYNNRNHLNYRNDSLLHYSLLVSVDGLSMDQRYFPHDEAEEEYIFSPSLYTFYDNDSLLLYCRNFDNIVYQLNKDGLKARYELNLPNPLPVSQIEQKRDEMELIRSGYSFGISNVYECDDILYFRFLKAEFIMATLYDLAEDKQICCSRGMRDNPTSKIPLFDTINGVYKGHFYGILTPGFIDYMTSEYPGEYPEIFKKYDAQLDNPIIAFYKVNRKSK